MMTGLVRVEESALEVSSWEIWTTWSEAGVRQADWMCANYTCVREVEGR